MLSRVLLAISLLVVSPLSRASLEGALWDPSQGGEGWTFESQNDVVAGTWYMYENDGSPSFRIFVAQSVADAQGRFVLTGDLFRVVTRGTSVREGAFTGVFTFSRGSIRGTVNAAGVARNLESFNYGYAEALDRLHGIWSFSLLGPGISDSIAVQFSRNVAIVNGIRTKQFVTSLGQPGAVIFDEANALYLGIASIGGGQFYCFDGDATDDFSVGIGYYGTANCTRTSNTFLNVAKSFVNTEAEYAAAGPMYRALLGFQTFPPQDAALKAQVSSELIHALTSGAIQNETREARQLLKDKH